jgi:hypothetical protein
MEKLKHTVEIARNMISEQEKEVIQLESKLHNFSYMWIALVTGMILLFCKSIDVYYKYITLPSYLLFFIYEFLGIIYITYLFFKVYIYDGSYKIIVDIKAYRGYCNSKDTLEGLMNAELDGLEKCITNNHNINNKRNSDLNSLKCAFKSFLTLKAILIIIIIFLN